MPNEKIEDGFASEMYKDFILDLYKNPKNFGILEDKTHSYKEFNRFCGDYVEIQLNVKKNIVRDARFIGKGCVISTVSASLLTDNIKGKSINHVKNINIKNIQEMLKIKIHPSRFKCALLPLEALIKSLNVKKDA